MARISLDTVIRGDFVNRFRGLAAGSTTSSESIQQALQGSAAKVTLSDGLRAGARLFADSLKSLNSALDLVNISRSTLRQLGDLTDKLQVIAQRADQPGIGSDQRNELDREFQTLGNQFEKIIASAKLGDREILDKEDLSAILQSVGLDQEQSNSIAKLFAEFDTSARDGALASPDSSVETSGGQSAALFSSDLHIRSRHDAKHALASLKALRQQINHNIQALDDTVKSVEENIKLIRSTGLAFLDVSQQLQGAEDADQVAALLRTEIRRNAGTAARQAENIEPIVVATLARET